MIGLQFVIIIAVDAYNALFPKQEQYCPYCDDEWDTWTVYSDQLSTTTNLEEFFSCDADDGC